MLTTLPFDHHRSTSKDRDVHFAINGRDVLAVDEPDVPS